MDTQASHPALSRQALALGALALAAFVLEAWWLASSRGTVTTTGILHLAVSGVLLGLPAILILVRPDAWTRWRSLTLGVLVLAAGPLLVTAWQLILRVLFPGYSGFNELPQALGAGFEIAARLAGLIGPVLMALGLVASLDRPLYRLMLRPAPLLLTLFGLLTVALRLSGFLAHADLLAPDDLAGGVLAAVSALAWVPLAAVAAAAVRQARPPRSAWMALLAAAPLYMVAEKLVADSTNPGMTAMGPAWLSGGLYLASALGVAIALANPGWPTRPLGADGSRSVPGAWV